MLEQLSKQYHRIRKYSICIRVWKINFVDVVDYRKHTRVPALCVITRAFAAGE